jgi:hypothetical protein
LLIINKMPKSGKQTRAQCDCETLALGVAQIKVVFMAKSTKAMAAEGAGFRLSEPSV